jgi:hypothetical protein
VKKMESPQSLVHSPVMKIVRAAALLVVLGLPLLAADDFWRHLTPDERKAAGFDQLNDEQRAVIERLARRFAERQANQTIPAVAEKAREEGRAEARAAALEQKKATIGLAPREDDETEVIRTRISGEFRGWTGRTRFTLANEQVWQQDQTENRFFPLIMDPEVEIRPSRLGGWKMTLLKEGLWIRVKRVR